MVWGETLGTGQDHIFKGSVTDILSEATGSSPQLLWVLEEFWVVVKLERQPSMSTSHIKKSLDPGPTLRKVSSWYPWSADHWSIHPLIHLPIQSASLYLSIHSPILPFFYYLSTQSLIHPSSHLFIHLSIHPLTYLPFHLSIHLPIYLFTHSPIHPSTYSPFHSSFLPNYLSFYPHTHPFSHLSTHLTVRSSIHPPKTILPAIHHVPYTQSVSKENVPR